MPRLDIVGKEVEDFNPLEPRWVNTIRLAELPWVADHKIQGDILFPGAAMMCAALEAVQQMSDDSKTVHSYELRDINISRALVIPTDGDEMKMTLHFKPRKLGAKATEMPWFEFVVFSQTRDDEHAEHCSGLVRARYVSEIDEDVEAAEDKAEWDELKKEYEACQRICTKDVKPADFYAKWNAFGMQFGMYSKAYYALSRIC